MKQDNLLKQQQKNKENFDQTYPSANLKLDHGHSDMASNFRQNCWIKIKLTTPRYSETYYKLIFRGETKKIK